MAPTDERAPLLRKCAVALVSSAAAATALRWFLKHEKYGRRPRGFSKSKFVKGEPSSSSRVAPNRDGYSKKKIPSDIDAIVIGSGIGGLTCAGFLTRAGKRVLVLEQHYIAGGCTHAFVESGYEFDTGIHYIGNIEKRHKYLELICPEGDGIEWDRMGEDRWTYDDGMVYDEVRIADWEPIKFKAGVEKYREELLKHFPDEGPAIDKYIKLCQKVAKKDFYFDLKLAKPKWLARVLNWVASKDFFNIIGKTALEVVREITPNEKLQAVFLAQFGDYGWKPSEESFFIHASVQNHYFNGGWYPRGGSGELANKIILGLERTGGRCLVRQGVKRILIERGQAVGVEMENGDVIRAPQVISATGVFNTFQKLLPPEHVPKPILQKIDKIGHSVSFIYLFVGMKGTPDELKLRSSNIWRWPDQDYDKMMADFEKDPSKAPIPMFIGFPCTKDSTWNSRFPGRSNSVIMTLGRYEWFEKWESERQGKRGADYQKLKDMFRDRILEEGLYKYFPQCRGTVDFTMVGSSLTFNHYIRSHRGEVYGLRAMPERFDKDDWLRPETNIPGLFMTGQDVTTLGVTGALMAGVLTAHACLGYGGPLDLISGRTLVEDIWNMEAKEKGQDVKAYHKTRVDPLRCLGELGFLPPEQTDAEMLKAKWK